MGKKLSIVLYKIMPVFYLVSAFLYILYVIQPTLYVHHVQPPFLLSSDFLIHYFKYPGGFSELIANFIIQSFYYKYLGPIVLLFIGLIIILLTKTLMDAIFKVRSNIFIALTTGTLAIILANNYNFPFSVVISIIIILVLLLFLIKRDKNPVKFLIYYFFGALITYYLLGSGFFIIYSLVAIINSTTFKLWKSLYIIIYILVFTIFIPQLAYNYIFAIPSEGKYFYFFASKPYFMAYKPTEIFYFLLLSIPVIVAITIILGILFKSGKTAEQKERLMLIRISASLIFLLGLTIYSHQVTFQEDEKKIVESDYYSYYNNPEKTLQASSTLKEYNFAANLNYNLVISKAGKLTENFFDFFQISGTEALHPDNRFLSEMSFIATDFYYNLGFISEARHWAYESLVFYPYSPRALQILVKIHLINKEYKAAERCLKILDKGLVSKNFVSEYSQYINDTTLISKNKEFKEKRSFIPAESELNPFIEGRFMELLKANSKNKTAYESLMLFYLLDAQMENFMDLYNDAGNYFTKPIDIYEEAILMFGEITKTDIKSKYKISPAAISRFEGFIKELKEFKGDSRSARNALYRQYGKTYMYYLQFLYPRIIKPEINNFDEQEPQI